MSDVEVGPNTDMASEVCPTCTGLERCLLLDDEELRRRQGRCLNARYEKCSICGVMRRDMPIASADGEKRMIWAFRLGKHYCPRCYMTLPSLKEMAQLGVRTTPGGEDDKKDKIIKNARAKNAKKKR